MTFSCVTQTLTRSASLPDHQSTTAPMKTLHGFTKSAFLVFFASHIPITLLIDSQALFRIHPKPVLDLVSWYSVTFKDELMTPPYQTWFTAIVTCEFLLQLPFFFIACYALWTGTVSGKGWFRSSCLVYGAHTCMYS
jgi:hypothetical protein